MWDYRGIFLSCRMKIILVFWEKPPSLGPSAFGYIWDFREYIFSLWDLQHKLLLLPQTITCEHIPFQAHKTVTMRYSLLHVTLAAEAVVSFPFVADVPGLIPAYSETLGEKQIIGVNSPADTTQVALQRVRIIRERSLLSWAPIVSLPMKQRLSSNSHPEEAMLTPRSFRSI
jgi:hypothetical protein